jgi:hypothetical protein
MNFSSFPKNLGFLVHPKLKGKSLDLGKNLFWELVPYVEVTLVSKFHLIWSTIAQESNLGTKGRILRENRVFQRPPTGQYPALSNNVQHDLDKVQPSVLSSKNPQLDNVQLYWTMSD